MRRGVFLLAILAIVVPPWALDQTTKSKTVGDRGQALSLLRMERDWAKAVVDRDPAVIERIEADDFIGWDFEGQPYTKAENIQALEGGYWITASLDLDDVKARVYGDAAVVTSRVTRKGRFRDQDLTGQFRWTRVYAQRRGRWELVAQQSTRIGDVVRSSSLSSEPMENVATRPAMSANIEEQVRQAENELTKALLQGDATTLNRLYTADYTHTGPDGVLSGKSDRIAEFRSGARSFSYLKRDAVEIRMYRMAAVVTDVDTMLGRFKGKNVSGRARAMRVWVKQGKGWELVAAHATALAQEKERHVTSGRPNEPPTVLCRGKAGGRSRVSSSRRRGAYAVGPVEAACALYAATMASLSAFALPLPGSAGRR